MACRKLSHDKMYNFNNQGFVTADKICRLLALTIAVAGACYIGIEHSDVTVAAVAFLATAATATVGLTTVLVGALCVHGKVRRRPSMSMHFIYDLGIISCIALGATTSAYLAMDPKLPLLMEGAFAATAILGVVYAAFSAVDLIFKSVGLFNPNSEMSMIRLEEVNRSYDKSR